MDNVENEMLVKTIRQSVISNILKKVGDIADIVCENTQTEINGYEDIGVFCSQADVQNIKENIVKLLEEAHESREMELEDKAEVMREQMGEQVDEEMEAKADLIRKYG